MRAWGAPAHLVCVMRVNNETGAIQDVARLAGIARSRGAMVFSDCVQALGKIPVDVRALGIDYAVVASHKIHGPKGIGALWAREGVP
ncbi:MAG: aminotransferase class V-fold PLP-dependent enzyme [Fibrobacteres bacterium]|nr:aminotransferase class V-fold PLP-dependent enzyme [Fibrobacterota bacterium]